MAFLSLTELIKIILRLYMLVTFLSSFNLAIITYFFPSNSGSLSLYYLNAFSTLLKSLYNYPFIQRLIELHSFLKKLVCLSLK